MNDAALVVRQALNPATGERVELDAPMEDLAGVLYETRTLEGRLRDFKKALGDELLARLDLDACWTGRAGEYEIRGESPAPRFEFDGNDLAQVLDVLVASEAISKDAAEAALETVITYKPKKRGIAALLKLGGKIAEDINATRREVEYERRAPSVRKAT